MFILCTGSLKKVFSQSITQLTCVHITLAFSLLTVQRCGYDQFVCTPKHLHVQAMHIHTRHMHTQTHSALGTYECGVCMTNTNMKLLRYAYDTLTPPPPKKALLPIFIYI